MSLASLTPSNSFNHSINVVILAAGQGKRMMSRLPKVLHSLAGVPMLVRVLNTALSLNPTPSKVVVVVGHGSDAVKATLPIDTVYATQKEQLGTGHAVAQALPLLNPALPTLVLCGDVPCINLQDLQDLLNLTQTGDMAVLTAVPHNPTGYGRIVFNNNTKTIKAIIEHKDCTIEQQATLTTINTGVMLLPAYKAQQWLTQLTPNNSQGEYYLTDCVELADREGVMIHAVQAGQAWHTEGVNSRSQLAHLERLYQREIADTLMQSGVMLLDPNRLDVRGSLICEKDVTIDVNCVFEGKVVLGEGVQIGANCILKNCTIGSNTQILPFTHIDGAIIGESNRIGPYARIRPHTQIADECHVGNFVELKNTQINHHSKVNHLSYIGDAKIGSEVNVGAGVITCNYDGVNKYQTIIEDRVFVGSDVQLIAPVVIGAGATIGAGTTLTKDAPNEQLTLSRTKQVNVPSWKRPVKIK